MELVRKFKEDFEKWYLNIYLDFSKESEQTKKMMLLIFYKKKFTERYGVYVDFGDSVDKRISVFPLIIRGVIIYEIFINESHYGDYGTRHEAREQSIIKLQNIYNEQRKDKV